MAAAAAAVSIMMTAMMMLIIAPRLTVKWSSPCGHDDLNISITVTFIIIIITFITRIIIYIVNNSCSSLRSKVLSA